jgi:hypothetical protein
MAASTDKSSSLVVTEGKEAWGKIVSQPHKSFAWYMQLAAALQAGRLECGHPPGKLKKMGRGFNEKFKTWREENIAWTDEHGRIHRCNDKALMSRLAEVQEHRGAIEDYLQRLASSNNVKDRRKLLKLNHPQAVLDN